MSSTGKEKANDGSEYIPSRQGSDVDADSDWEAVEGEELGPHESEVRKPDGTIEIIRGPLLTVEETKEKEEAILKAARDDPRFDQLTERRLMRFVPSMMYFKQASELQGQAVHDFSDNAPFATGTVAGTKFKYIACKAVNFIKIGGRIRKMTDEEMASKDNVNSPCDCELCTKREENGFEKKPGSEVGLRSGKKRTWDKRYGCGRTL